MHMCVHVTTKTVCSSPSKMPQLLRCNPVGCLLLSVIINVGRDHQPNRTKAISATASAMLQCTPMGLQRLKGQKPSPPSSHPHITVLRRDRSRASRPCFYVQGRGLSPGTAPWCITCTPSAHSTLTRLPACLERWVGSTPLHTPVAGLFGGRATRLGGAGRTRQWWPALHSCYIVCALNGTPGREKHCQLPLYTSKLTTNACMRVKHTTPCHSSSSSSSQTVSLTISKRHHTLATSYPVTAVIV